MAEADGEVRGYAYSSAYRPKAGYRHTRETTIYLAEGAQGQGLGRRMYGDLLDLLVADGIHLAVAGIALPNPASVALHRAFGFDDVGVMRGVGRKFDRWLDVLWLQKTLVALSHVLRVPQTGDVPTIEHARRRSSATLTRPRLTRSEEAVCRLTRPFGCHPRPQPRRVALCMATAT